MRDPYRPPPFVAPPIAIRPTLSEETLARRRAKAEQWNKIKAVHLGVDLGQTQDFSAVCVVGVGECPTDQVYELRGERRYLLESTYQVQKMQRLDLGTSWADIARYIVALVGKLWDWERDLREAGALEPSDPQLPWNIWADATGLGRPVMEMIRNLLESNPKTDRATLHPVGFTHGDRFVRGGWDNGVGDMLGKAYLVSRLQTLAQADPPRVQLPPRDPEAAAMMQELKDYRIKVDENANDKYGAFSTGAHDDLVTSLGLACIEDPGYYSVEYGPGLWP